MRSPLRPAVAAALSLSVIGLTACSGDDSPTAADDPSSASSWRNGYSITLVFELDQALLKQQPDLVDSVLASITWT